jgi:hypothetical protein
VLCNQHLPGLLPLLRKPLGALHKIHERLALFPNIQTLIPPRVRLHVLEALARLYPVDIVTNSVDKPMCGILGFSIVTNSVDKPMCGILGFSIVTNSVDKPMCGILGFSSVTNSADKPGHGQACAGLARERRANREGRKKSRGRDIQG